MDVKEIHEIMRQFDHGYGEWKQFIESIKISNIHGWNGQEMKFEFPVVAVVGENGIGKSTFLKAALCAYKKDKTKMAYYPSKLFVNTQWDETALNGATIEYRVRQGNERKQLIWKKRNGWGFTPHKGKPERNVFYFSISRTLPKDATAGYVKVAMNANEEAGEVLELSEENRKEYSYIMGQEYTNARFTGTNVDKNKEIGLVTTKAFGEISQFHQGAGEDSVLDMFKILQDIPKQSMVVIDEVENSLHPKAQRRLMQYLLRLARIKKLQIIVSTHSAYVLDELPPIARIMLVKLSDQKDIIYEVSSEYAMSAIDEISHPEMYIYMEDHEAVALFWEIIKRLPGKYDDFSKRIYTQPAGSASVIQTLERLSREGKLPNRSMGIIDGDKSADHPDCPSLPGAFAPERMVFEDFKKINWDKLEDRFGMGAGGLYAILDEAVLQPDHHQWTTFVGDRIKKSSQVVWQIMAEEWCKQCLKQEDAEAFAGMIQKRLEG